MRVNLPSSWAIKRSVIILLLGLGVFACAPEPTFAPLPTLTLVQVAPTATPLPSPTPIITTPLPQPDDIRPADATPPIPEFIVPPVSEITLNPDRIVQAQFDLARYLDVDVTIVRPATLTYDRLYYADFACPKPNNLANILQQYHQFHEQMRYRLTLLVGVTLHTYHLTETSLIKRCPPSYPVTDELLLAVDPIAQELTLLAQRRIAQELDLPLVRVQIQSAQAYTWIDTSLGCPAPNQTYDAISIDGYRLVLQAGDRQYSFHTDASTLFACPQGREQLP